MRTIIKNNIFANKTAAMWILILICTLFSFINICSFVSSEYDVQAKEIIRTSKLYNYCMITDYGSDDYSLSGMKHLYNDLKEAYPDTYHEIAEQFIYVFDYAGPEKFRDPAQMDPIVFLNGDTEHSLSALKTLQISLNAIGNASVIEAGRLFNQNDYVQNYPYTVPVILGCDYKEILQIGDTFVGEYLTMPMVFEVIGFFKSEVMYNTGWNLQEVSQFIVMPMFNCESISEDIENDSTFQVKHYKRKLLGFFHLPDTDYSTLSAEVNNLAKEYTLPEFEARPTDPVHSVQIGFITLRGEFWSLIYNACAMLSSIICLIVFSLLWIRKLHSNILRYGTQITLGVPFSHIKIALAIEIAVYLILCNGCAITAAYLLFGELIYRQLLIFLSIGLTSLPLLYLTVLFTEKHIILKLSEADTYEV